MTATRPGKSGPVYDCVTNPFSKASFAGEMISDTFHSRTLRAHFHDMSCTSSFFECPNRHRAVGATLAWSVVSCDNLSFAIGNLPVLFSLDYYFLRGLSHVKRLFCKYVAQASLLLPSEKEDWVVYVLALAGTFVINMPKQYPGEVFTGLDLLTKLLAPNPKPSTSTPLIEVVGKPCFQFPFLFCLEFLFRKLSNLHMFEVPLPYSPMA